MACSQVVHKKSSVRDYSFYPCSNKINNDCELKFQMIPFQHSSDKGSRSVLVVSGSFRYLSTWTASARTNDKLCLFHLPRELVVA